MTTYCDVARGHPLHGPYHDRDYGFPVTDDALLFERLILEINQAGLSWATILMKRDAFRRAYAGYDIDAVARFGARDRKRLLGDPGIVRNRLKIDAAIENAHQLMRIRSTHGSFAAWLAAHHPRDKAEWVKLFRSTFRFTGGEITTSFLLCIGYLPGAHDAACPVYAQIAALDPPWKRLEPDRQETPEFCAHL